MKRERYFLKQTKINGLKRFLQERHSSRSKSLFALQRAFFVDGRLFFDWAYNIILRFNRVFCKTFPVLCFKVRLRSANVTLEYTYLYLNFHTLSPKDVKSFVKLHPSFPVLMNSERKLRVRRVLPNSLHKRCAHQVY